MITEQEKLTRQAQAVAMHKWIDVAHFDAEDIAGGDVNRYMSNINAIEVMGAHGEAVMEYIYGAVGGAGGMKDLAVLLNENSVFPLAWLDICKYYLGEAVFLLAEEILDDGNCGEGGDQ